MSMQSQINNNILKFAVGQAIFCPTCKGSLDAKTAVLLTSDKGNGISCGKCFTLDIELHVASIPDIEVQRWEKP